MIRICRSCGAKNHVPARHLADTGRCGACKSDLSPAAEPIDVSDREFDEIVGEVKVPILVDFWAAWCGPCRMAAPEVKKAAAGLAGKAVVLKVDTEAHPNLAARFGVRGIPNFLVLRGGKVVHQQAGLVPADTMERWVSQA